MSPRASRERPAKIEVRVIVPINSSTALAWRRRRLDLAYPSA
jgi:hypothetical protein